MLNSDKLDIVIVRTSVSQNAGNYDYVHLAEEDVSIVAGNGNAVYHSNPNSVSAPGATDVFTYTVRDADGDESSTTITIDVYNSCLVAETDPDITVYEKALHLNHDGQDLAPRPDERRAGKECVSTCKHRC